MNRIGPVGRYCVCVSAAVACSVALATCAPHGDAWDYGIVDRRAAYLDCARIAARKVLEPDLVTLCSMVAAAREGAAPGG